MSNTSRLPAAGGRKTARKGRKATINFSARLKPCPDERRSRTEQREWEVEGGVGSLSFFFNRRDLRERDLSVSEDH